MPINRVHTIVFPNGNSSRLIHPPSGATAREILSALALPVPRALVVLNGGTAQLEPTLQARLAAALAGGLARIVSEEGITTITGGTEAGIFQLFGQGLGRWGRAAPCIGVAPAAKVSWPGQPRREAVLEPHHSHFVLVAGDDWGDETGTMYALAAELARAAPSVAVFAGGGEIAVREMLANVAQGRPMILLAGSGRATDEVLAARAGMAAGDDRMAQIARHGRILPVPIEAGPGGMQEAVRQLLPLDARREP